MHFMSSTEKKWQKEVNLFCSKTLPKVVLHRKEKGIPISPPDNIYFIMKKFCQRNLTVHVTLSRWPHLSLSLSLS